MKLIPSLKYLEKHKNRIITGSVSTTEAAYMGHGSVEFWLNCVVIITLSVCIFESGATSISHINSFQRVIKTDKNTMMLIDLVEGSAIL